MQSSDKILDSKVMDIIVQLKGGSLSAIEAQKKIMQLTASPLPQLTLDVQRVARKGFPEVVFCQGKTTEESLAALAALARHHRVVLGTRASREVGERVTSEISNAMYFERSRIILIGEPIIKKDASVGILSAGTADEPAAEEAALTATAMGACVTRYRDIGIAGLHRLLSHYDDLQKHRVLVVVAGMEGALPSVVAGLVAPPVIAVPTSVGYGSSFEGLSALLAMMNSCAPGISVVNIDNGFGAGYQAALIARANHGESLS